MAQPIELLCNGLMKLQVSLSDHQQLQLLDYLKLLQKWNKTYNLTAITDFEKMISYHLLDSLSVSPYLCGETIVDVGSGAGLPGIPLSICFPDKQFTLIDSVGKKTRFISQVIRELKLKNVTVINARAEESEKYQIKNAFDTMIARAVASVETLVELSTHLLKKNGTLLMMKSDAAQEDPAILKRYHAQIETLTVPGVTGDRSLIIMRDMA